MDKGKRENRLVGTCKDWFPYKKVSNSNGNDRRRTPPPIDTFEGKSFGFKGANGTQDYQKLRQYHVQNNSLFEDDFFLPSTELPNIGAGKIEWKRPKDIVSYGAPAFVVDGISRFDIRQGKLGDCWFLAAINCVMANEKLFSLVVPDPDDQSFSDGYAGIFHFRFWHCGRWRDVVVDDKLPTVDGKLIYLNAPENEFWPPLLEKAYAKFYGSYANIESGVISDALEDMSGGLSEHYRIGDTAEIYKIMKMCHNRSSFMGCFISSSTKEVVSSTQEVMCPDRPDGLREQHAYSITDMETVQLKNGTVRQLVRLTNPWGHTEWVGEWSDKSEIWFSVSEEVKNRLLRVKDDGEFWMDFENFRIIFTHLNICHLDPNSTVPNEDIRRDKTWDVSIFEGCWIQNVTAGGGRDNIDTFANNPQYFFSLKKGQQEKFYVVIGLMQENSRHMGERCSESLELNIYKVKTKGILDKPFFDKNDDHQASITNHQARQLTVRWSLPPGKYCVIPSTVEPNKNGRYILRVYSETATNLMENDDAVEYFGHTYYESMKWEATGADDSMKISPAVYGNAHEIGWVEVQAKLKSIHRSSSFTEHTCKNIVALYDFNYSGKLDLMNFGKMSEDVIALKKRFEAFDVDQSGRLDGFELRNVLHRCGYKVNNNILVIIMLRYGHNGTLDFENFVVCVLKLRKIIEGFRNRQAINLQDWLQAALYS